jgi:hypothetical protein
MLISIGSTSITAVSLIGVGATEHGSSSSLHAAVTCERLAAPYFSFFVGAAADDDDDAAADASVASAAVVAGGAAPRFGQRTAGCGASVPRQDRRLQTCRYKHGVSVHA